jgi:hypothetical protein
MPARYLAGKAIGGWRTIRRCAQRLVQVGATVFGYEPDQLSGFRPIDRVVDKSPGAMRTQQSASGQCVQVMRQRRARHPDAPLDLFHAASLRAGAHQQAEDLEPAGLSQRAQLRHELLHYDNSSIIEMTGMQTDGTRIRNHFGGLLTGERRASELSLMARGTSARRPAREILRRPSAPFRTGCSACRRESA